MPQLPTSGFVLHEKEASVLFRFLVFGLSLNLIITDNIFSDLIYIEIIQAKAEKVNCGSLEFPNKEFELYPTGSREQKISEPEDENCALGGGKKFLWQQVRGQLGEGRHYKKR